MDEESENETDCNASVRQIYIGGPQTSDTRSKESPVYGGPSLHSTQEVTLDLRRTVCTSAGGGDREYPAPIVNPPPILQVPRSTFDPGTHYSCAEPLQSISADGGVECDGHRQEHSPVGSPGVAKMEQFVASGSPYKKAGKRKPRRCSAKHPKYISYDKRFESFNGWPRGLPSPKKMAKAGFFYEGTRVVENETYIDMVTCYQCGKTLHSWTGTDDPVEEHRRIYPTKPCVKHLL
ncbi:uncharacterized protein LOC128226956 [Mya arenaria]|nr:uncharacterized protein LOC128226956 [Mya arenaria]XP_052793047.1 uncharacterized protein LOC128226956 [Mya arenaria]XP_052793049.1 uncharacterized protein LOC128226956 [Mya arenaria]